MKLSVAEIRFVKLIVWQLVKGVQYILTDVKVSR